jgi:tripartite motif-containing protein 71
MRTIRLLVVAALLGMSPDILQAEEAYRVAKIWPEAPQGWHFYQPWAVAVDESGNVYIGDRGNYCVKKFDPEGRFINEWGSPGRKDGQLDAIFSIRVGRSGIVYVLDAGRIQKFTPYGQLIGLFERKAPSAGRIKLSVDMAVDDKGNVFVLAADWVEGQRRIRSAVVEGYSPDGKCIAQWGMDSGNGDGRLQIPAAIDIDVSGDIYIADYDNDSVQKFDLSGRFLTKWGRHGKGEGRFLAPGRIAIS